MWEALQPFIPLIVLLALAGGLGFVMGAWWALREE